MAKKYIDIPPLTKEQTNILIGSLLGDGSCYFLKSENANSHFSKGQREELKEYVDWHLEKFPVHRKLMPAWNKKVGHDKNGKIFLLETPKEELKKKWVFSTRSHPIFTEYRKNWYPHGVKIVPTDIQLNEQTVAIWYCDDGHNVPTRRCAYFHTDSFMIEECNFLIKRMEKDLNIKCNLAFHRGYPKIRVRSVSYLEFIKKVSPHIPWKCLKYKIDLSNYKPLTGPKTKLKKEEVEEIIELYFYQKYTHEELANKFGVGKAAIGKIIRGERWKNIERPNITRFYAQHKIREDNKSGCIGVWWSEERKKWISEIKVNKKKKYIGSFKEKKDAIKSRKKAEKELL